MRNVVKEAQSGGVAKGKPNMGKAPGTKGDGLKTAWMPDAKRGAKTDMPMARKKVR
jgi:hypothetical protein